MALTMDFDYAMAKIAEHIQIEEEYCRQEEEFHNSMIREEREKNRQYANDIIKNLDWNIVDPFYYHGNFDANFIERSTSAVFKNNDQIKVVFRLYRQKE